MKKYITRFIIYIVGLFLLAFGVGFSVRSQTGISPVSSLPYVVSEISGKSVGTITFVIFFIYIILQIIILRKEFKPKDLLQIVFASVFGIFTDLALFILQDITASNYFFQLVLLGISLIIIPIGVFFVLITDIVVNAPDGLCIAIAKKTNMEFSKVKTIFDVTIVALAAILARGLLGHFSQIREGTVIAALVIGKLVGIIQGKYSDRVKKLFIEEKPDAPKSEILLENDEVNEY